MRERPICFGCTEQIDHDPVFEAPCGHDRCPSCAFHPLCLAEWREQREHRTRQWRLFLDRMMRDHRAESSRWN